MDKLVEMYRITKTFPGVIANDNVNFDLRRGEIHGLLGENGAGKSTLMNILSGLLRPDSGEIYVKGSRVKLGSPREAIERGIFMVHQHFMLIPSFTVTENIVLGTRSGRGPFLDLKQAENDILALSERYGLYVNPSTLVWQLSAGERQRVEILKALYRKADILILDEPTSNLSPPETSQLFDILRRIKSEQKGVILITHKIYEALEVCDRITILRRGKVVGSFERGQFDERRLVSLMVGGELTGMGKTKSLADSFDRPLLEVRDLSVVNELGFETLSGVSFSVYRGEILGIAGVAGNGQNELVEALAGLRRPAKGNIIFEGREISHLPSSSRYRLGIYYIPDKRIEVGISSEMSVYENLILGFHDEYAKSFLLDYSRVRSKSRELIREFDIKTPSENAEAGTLSGGNIQRLILARGLSRCPKLIIANQPTAGLDVAATSFVHSKLLALRSSGTAILLVSTDLDEILDMSDRIMVMYKGRVMGMLRREEASKTSVGALMMGIKGEGVANS